MKVKRILSSIMAAVMVATSLVTVNVSSVWAAATDNTTYGKSPIINGGKTREWDFTTNMPTSKINRVTVNNVGDSVHGITLMSKGTSDSGKLVINEGGYLSFFEGAIIHIPVPAGSFGTITLTAQSGNTNRFAYIDNNTTDTSKKIACTTEGSAVDFDDSIKKSGYIELGRGTTTNEFKIAKINVTLGKPDKECTLTFGEAATEYTYSGTCIGLNAGDKFTLGSQNVEVTDGGNYSFVSTDKLEGTYKAALMDYVISYGEGKTGVTFTDEGNNTYKADTTITFTKPELTALTEPSYDGPTIIAGLPNFEITAISGKTLTRQVVNTSWARIGNADVKFILDEPKEVTINAKCANSNDANKKVTFSIAGVQIGGENSIELAGGSGSAEYKATLPAGTHTLTVTSDTTSLEIEYITLADVQPETSAFNVEIKEIATGKYLVFGKLTGTPADFDMVGIKLGRSADTINKDVSSTAVYNGIVVDDHTETGESLFGVLVTLNAGESGNLFAKGYSVKNGAAPVEQEATSLAVTGATGA